uniref:30S ribosomal protein S6, chloroplastic n=1 Tax=Halydictyon mirabile TaxID=189652 RepID=A0A4D6WTU0_9FLOR|nr:ribosomal protein S6 [Halydictyon mirabile]
MYLKNYETIYVLKPNGTDTINLSIINYYKTFIKQKGGLNLVVQHRGRRHLSYNINNYYDGIYIQMNYKANGKLIKSLEQSMRIDSNIIRYLIVKSRIEDSLSIF